MFRWPDGQTVDRAVREWAHAQVATHPSLRRIGYVGSYARGDWGVGSDVDLVVLVAESDQPFWRRPVAWDTTSLPVPADCLVYTLAEWHQLGERGTRFYRTVEREAVWVYTHGESESSH